MYKGQQYKYIISQPSHVLKKQSIDLIQENSERAHRQKTSTTLELGSTGLYNRYRLATHIARQQSNRPYAPGTRASIACTRKTEASHTKHPAERLVLKPNVRI